MKYRLAFAAEKPPCKCNDCWVSLKQAIQGASALTFYYMDDTNDAYYKNGDIYINPEVRVLLPEQRKNGSYAKKLAPFPIVVWHEAIGHSKWRPDHEKVPNNYEKNWDGLYQDVVVGEENRARACTRLLQLKYGGFLFFPGRTLGDRRPTYFDGSYRPAKP